MAHVNEDKDILKFAGDYNLDVCTIISYQKSPDHADLCIRHNILPQVLSITLVEDISLQVISGGVREDHMLRW